jgi:hypothetical protein
MPLVPLAGAAACTPAAPARADAGSESPRTARRTVAWSLVAGGAAALAGGIVAQAVRQSDVSVYDDDTLCFFGGLTRDQRCGRYRSAAEQAQVFAIVGYATAAVALSTAAILFATDGTSEPRRSKPRGALSCGGIPPLQMACAASF